MLTAHSDASLVSAAMQRGVNRWRNACLFMSKQAFPQRASEQEMSRMARGHGKQLHAITEPDHTAKSLDGSP